MEGLFSVGLLALTILVIVVVAAAVRGAVLRRRGETDATAEPVTSQTSDPREYFKSVGSQMGEEMKVRIYSLEEYDRDLGGDAAAARQRGFRAALKAYRAVEDDWYDYPPEKAAEALELSSDDYVADRTSGALLLKKTPPGLPASARDAFDA